MKTALNEWFDELKVNYPYMANEIFDKGFNKYLEKEKDQLFHSFYAGSGIDYYQEFIEQFNEYFNQTYKQNK